MMRLRAAAGERALAARGLTLIELMVYLGLMGAFLSTIAGADLLARKLNRRDGAVVRGLQSRDQIERLVRGDLGSARAVRLGAEASGGPDVVFAIDGGATWRLDRDAATVLRDNVVVAGGVLDMALTRASGTPGLFELRLVTAGDDQAASGPRDDTGERAWRQSFVARPLVSTAGAPPDRGGEPEAEKDKDAEGRDGGGAGF